MSHPLPALHAAVVAALKAHAPLAGLTGIYDGPPPRARFPYLVISDGLVGDWSTKTETGREVRLALTLWDDGEAAARLHTLMAEVETALSAFPAALDGWRVVSTVFLRSLVVRDPAGPWAGLIEHRIRILEA